MLSTTLDHYTIRTTDLEATCCFYEEILGLIVGQRPNFPFPGVWLYNAPPNDGVPLVHVIEEDIRRPSRVDGRSNVDHLAFRIVDFRRFSATWKKWGITPPTNQRFGQLFISDPNDVVVEIVYGIYDKVI